MNILHLLMYRENIVFWRPSKKLELVMKEVTQTVKFIKTRSLDKICSQMCTDISSDDMHVLCHSEVRWLPRVNVLQRAVALLSEVETFFSRLKFSDSKWI